MLVLSSLHDLLGKVLDRNELHTAVLMTPEGELVSYAASPVRSKDDIRVLVGLSSEIWQETKSKRVGMVESELGRVLVIPIAPEPESADIGPLPQTTSPSTPFEPLMLLALNSTDSVDWKELRQKAQELADHLAKPIGQLRGRMTYVSPSPPVRSPRRSNHR